MSDIKYVLVASDLRRNKKPRLRTGDPSKMKTPNLFIVI